MFTGQEKLTNAPEPEIKLMRLTFVNLGELDCVLPTVSWQVEVTLLLLGYILDRHDCDCLLLSVKLNWTVLLSWYKHLKTISDELNWLVSISTVPTFSSCQNTIIVKNIYQFIATFIIPIQCFSINSINLKHQIEFNKLLSFILCKYNFLKCLSGIFIFSFIQPF